MSGFLLDTFLLDTDVPSEMHDWKFAKSWLLLEGGPNGARGGDGA